MWCFLEIKLNMEMEEQYQLKLDYMVGPWLEKIYIRMNDTVIYENTANQGGTIHIILYHSNDARV